MSFGGQLLTTLHFLAPSLDCEKASAIPIRSKVGKMISCESFFRSVKMANIFCYLYGTEGEEIRLCATPTIFRLQCCFKKVDSIPTPTPTSNFLVSHQLCSHSNFTFDADRFILDLVL